MWFALEQEKDVHFIQNKMTDNNSVTPTTTTSSTTTTISLGQNNFFKNNTTVERIDFCCTELNNIKAIEPYFASGCPNLTSVDLTALISSSPSLIGTTIPSHFLSLNKSLTQIDLSPVLLTRVSHVDDFVCAMNPALQSVTITSLPRSKSRSRLQSIGHRFLAGCTSLQTIEVCSTELEAFPNLTSVGAGFLSRCHSLTSLSSDVTRTLFPKACTELGDSFLACCTSLTGFCVPSHICHIGDSFLSGCRSLVVIDLTNSTSIFSLGHHFLQDCISLTRVDMRCLTNVTSIGGAFLKNCKRLKEADLSGLTSVKWIGENNSIKSSHTVFDKDNNDDDDDEDEEFLLPFTGCNSLEDLEVPVSGALHNAIMK
eukprot:PhM_4_TR16591/c0_g3_i1/m.2612